MRASDCLSAQLKSFVIVSSAILASLFSIGAFAENEKILEVLVEGNRAVQTDAVRGLMNSRAGEALRASDVRADVKALFKSGYFQDVRIDKKENGSGVTLVVHVVEKPSIKEIKFFGFSAVTPSSLDDKLQVKKYTIVDERKINSDLRLIEQMYSEKGYYLARASYTLSETSSGEVVLTYNVLENNSVSVAKVNLLGNVHFADEELKTGMATREKRWTSWFNNAGTFKDEFVNRDKEFLAYILKDSGFAEAIVGTPQSRLDTGRQNVEVSYFIEEGERFNVGSIKITGDLIFPEATVLEQLSLKSGKYFRISQFQNDMRMLTDKYGDEGYAFVDVVPKTSANREKRIIDLEYNITKGEKVYFRKIVIEGNSKTRDNVIRRNLKVVEGDRFHATGLEKSKTAIERLGFFQEVQLQREPDQKNNAMDLRIKVKEKSTGTLSASVGASPSADGKTFNFFGQGQYSEANLIGKGWNAGISANWTPPGNYGLNMSLTEPSIQDGPWSATIDGSFKYAVEKPFEWEAQRYTKTIKAGLSLGREIFVEDLRLSNGYSYERIISNDVLPYLRRFTQTGDTERIYQSLSYDRTDNFMQPTSGFNLNASNTFGVKLTGGQHRFGKIEGQAAVYIPIVMGEDFKTNFRLAFEPAFVYPLSGVPVPVWERLKLGTFLNMKAYTDDKIISPKVLLVDSPQSLNIREINRGGNRRFYGTIEYFIPVIPEANLRLVTFGESGTVLDDNESFSTDKLKYDVGFGFRWLTPIAPFRFEWAWPIQKGKLGDSAFIFFVGNDSATSLN